MTIVSGKLFSVAVPIGNQKDITIRAKEILETVNIIACEDTRKTKSLFSRLNILKYGKLLSYYSYNEESSAKSILKQILSGKHTALISDAGTPRINDPGYHLLKLCWANNIRVIPVPGASSLSCLLSICPFSIEPLLFLGFLSSKAAKRRKVLNHYKNFLGGVLILESVHRIKLCLSDILDIWGEHDILIGRELTKVNEDIYLDKISEAIKWCNDKKGEFILLIDKKNT